jgi:hypothetical protein
MANYYSDPLRPARPGRINAQVQPTPTYHGESLTPDYSAWMPGLADYDRLQRNRAAGVPLGQYGPAYLPRPPAVPAPAPAAVPAPSPAATASAVSDGARRFFPSTGYYGVGNQLTPSPSPSTPGATSGVKPPPMPDAFSGASVGAALASPPHLIEGMPSSQWFGQQARRMQQSKRFATYDPHADAPEDAGLDARAMHGGASFTDRPHYTREQLAKMDAASLAALALRPRAPELQRQWLQNPASLPALKQRTVMATAPQRRDVSHVPSLAARALYPRFGPGASSSSTLPTSLTRSGPRSAAELAKLPPAAIAALALQPRGPHMMRQWREAQRAALARSRGGLNAGAFNAPKDLNATPPVNSATLPLPSPAWTPPSLPDPAFSIDPQSYLQPPTSPAQASTPRPGIGDQAPIFTTAARSSADEPLPFGDKTNVPSPAAFHTPAPRTPAGIAGDPTAPDAWKNTGISAGAAAFPQRVPIGSSPTVDPLSFLQPTSPPPASDTPQPFVGSLNIPTEGEPQPPLTPEQQKVMDQWKDIEKRTNDLVTTGNRIKEALGPQVETHYLDQRTVDKLRVMSPYIKKFAEYFKVDPTAVALPMANEYREGDKYGDRWRAKLAENAQARLDGQPAPYTARQSAALVEAIKQGNVSSRTLSPQIRPTQPGLPNLKERVAEIDRILNPKSSP